MHRVFLFHERGVKGSSRCSVAAMATFCLLSACKDAPLGQRQGGVFRLPPPYLWTPPTPQRAKGYSPLTILKKKSKHKKASAAPVGAIALTLFSLLHLKPFSRCATAPPRGSGHARSAALSQKAALHLPFSSTTPPVKRQFWKIRRFSRIAKFKIILPLNMPRATRRAFKIVPHSQKAAAR